MYSECEECGNAFRDKYGLKRHEKHHDTDMLLLILFDLLTNLKKDSKNIVLKMLY